MRGAKFADTPLLLKVKSGRGCKRAVALITELMSKLNIARIEREAQDFRMPYEDTEALLARGLVKLIPTKEEEALSVAASDETAENAPAQEVCEYAVGDTIELASIDFNDAEFSQSVTAAMVDKFGITLHAVVVERKAFVGRTYLRLSVLDMPRAMRKRLRVRPKNFIFLGEQTLVGIAVPYTREEYAALPASKKKTVLEYATRMRAYSIVREQLAMLRILKTDDIKMVEKFKKLEARLAWLAGELPLEARWRALIKD